MQILNPFRMNDWPIKKFLIVVLAFQMALWGVISLDAQNIHIPLLREIISLVYLLFIPGVVILRIFKVHKIGSIESLLYSIGLSIAFVMFTGLVMNIIYPTVGISRPISLMPLVITISALAMLLCCISYFRDRTFSEPTFYEFKEVFNPPALLLYLIPLISILGTSFVNAHQNSVFLMILIAVIALVALLVGFNKFFPKNLYPLAIFSIALSLLFFRSLISTYISGFDIHDEYYFANLVKTNGVWNSNIHEGFNALASIVMVGPVSSLFSGMSLTWVFKIIYPLLFAVATVALYQIFHNQTDDRVAFLACFFFMAYHAFYMETPILPRQEIAIIFLVAILLLLVGNESTGMPRSAMSIIFAASLVVSHYGLAFIFASQLFLAWLILSLFEVLPLKSLRNTNVSRPDNDVRQPSGARVSQRTLRFVFVAAFLVMTFVWHDYFSPVFKTYVRIGQSILSDMASSIGSVHLLGPKTDLLSRVHDLLYNGNQGLIILGMFVLLVWHRQMKFRKESKVLIVLSFIFMFLGIRLLGKEFKTARLYDIALIFLAPLLVVGAFFLMKTARQLVHKVRATDDHWLSGLLSLYLVLYFLFETGFVFRVVDKGTSLPLTEHRASNYSTIEKVNYFSGITMAQDVASAEWLSRYRQTGVKIYAMYNDVRVHPTTSYGMIPFQDVIPLARAATNLQELYIYMQYVNVAEGIGMEYDEGKLMTFNITYVSNLFDNSARIYTSGGSEIYR